MYDEAQQALLDAMNERLDATIKTTADAVSDNDREFAVEALGVAVLLMAPEQLMDLAFAAILRLVDQEVANRG